MTSTIPASLTEYQEFVRKEALQVQRDMGISDEKLNTMLRNLGLPEKQNFHVPVEVTGRMVVVINVDEGAQTETEAREKLAALSEEELRIRVMALVPMGSFSNVTGKVTTIPDTFAVGDLDLTLSNRGIYTSMQSREERRQCENYQPNSSSYCTLRRGHDGDQHVAGNGTTITAVWPVEN